MSEDGLSTPDNSQPRYRPVWDEKQRVWVGRSVEQIEKEERQAAVEAYADAVRDLLRAQAVLERALSESADRRLVNRQVVKALRNVRRTAVIAEKSLPKHLLDNVDDV